MRSSLLAPLLWAVPFVLAVPAQRNATESRVFPSLINVTLDELSHGLDRGHFTSQDLVRAYIERITEVNDILHCVTEINPDALSIAASLDEARRNGVISGPLHGIPILIKNNIATDDEMNNTAGSFSLLGAKVPRDSTVAAKLRRAGAIILGKANLSQWANNRSVNATNGWSAYGGQTFGAYYPNQDPRGSSSGSAVASALGLALASLGTDTSGSITSPSQRSNVVGIKPSVGLTSRYLVIPISEHQDTVGPIARTVKDAAYLLDAIAGHDPRDNYTNAIPFYQAPNYAAACKQGSLRGARIGVPRNVLDIPAAYLDAPVIAAFNRAVEQIEAAGATIVDANFTAYPQFLNDNNETLVGNADFLTGLARYFSELTYNPNNITDLAGETAFTHAFPAEDWPAKDTGDWDGPEGALTQGWNNTDPRFWPAYQVDLFYGGEGGILGALERTNTTAVLLPTVRNVPTTPSMIPSIPQLTPLLHSKSPNTFQRWWAARSSLCQWVSSPPTRRW